MHRLRGSIILLTVCAVAAAGCADRECPNDGNLAECLLEVLTVRDADQTASGLGSTDNVALELAATGEAELAPSADQSQAPQVVIVNDTPGVPLVVPDDSKALGFSWTDPNPCRPALCIRFCHHGACTSKSRCTPMVSDGLNNGSLETFVSLAAVIEEPVEVELAATPLSAPGCPDLAEMGDGDVPGLQVGAQQTTPLALEPGLDRGGEGEGEGECPGAPTYDQCCGGGNTGCAVSDVCDCPSGANPESEPTQCFEGESPPRCVFCSCWARRSRRRRRQGAHRASLNLLLSAP